jgi:hypothetical protein
MDGGIRIGRYRHFKGNWYVVEGTATHTETEEVLVIYFPEGKEKRLFARPLSMFLEDVPEDKENPTGQARRFMHEDEI